MWTDTSDLKAAETALRRRQRSPEAVVEMATGVAPFSAEGWRRDAPPATPEELAGQDEFLRQRAADREASLAREAGVEAAG